MYTKDLKSRTEKLKTDINNLLAEYINETSIIPDAFQGVVRVVTVDNDNKQIISYDIDLGLRL